MAYIATRAEGWPVPRLPATSLLPRKGTVVPWRLIQRPTFAALIAGLATALVVAAAGYHGILEPLEARTYDWRLRVRRPLPPRSPELPRIVLVEVTEQTYQAYAGQPRTFWGDRYASAIRRLGRQG